MASCAAFHLRKYMLLKQSTIRVHATKIESFAISIAQRGNEAVTMVDGSNCEMKGTLISHAVRSKNWIETCIGKLLISALSSSGKN